MKHGTGVSAPQSGMYFGDAGVVDETTRVLGLDAPAGHDDRPALGLPHQLRDGFLTLQASRFATGREHTIDARAAKVLKSAEQVRRHVEGAMEGDGEWTRLVR